VEADKTQVATEASVGQGSVKALSEMQIYKNTTFFTNMFVSVKQQC